MGNKVINREPSPKLDHVKNLGTLSINNTNIAKIYLHENDQMTVYPVVGNVVENVAMIIPLPETELSSNLIMGKCVSCFDRTINSAIVDCGHACLCVTCIRDWILRGNTHCPLCSHKISRVIRLYTT